MTALLLEGRHLAQQMRAALTDEIAAFQAGYGRAPGLAVVQVEGDSASTRYLSTIANLCAALGVAFRRALLPAGAEQSALMQLLDELNAAAEVDGVLIQMPLPAYLDVSSAVLRLDYRKDVDGVHPINAGLLAQGRFSLVPNTPAGGIELLRHYGIELRGRRAAVVGRSAIVGRPLAAMLTLADATVTVCHTRTIDLGAVLRECDLVVVAAGRPGLITGEMLRPGAVVVDFGTNVCADGRLVGDVDFASAAEVASAITPVPGGTGPVTNVMLIRNVLLAARLRASAE